MRKQLPVVFVGLTAIMLSGCWSLAPSYQRPPIELPAGWGTQEGQDASAFGRQWWRIFEDDQLNELVDEALTNNANLQIALARVDEARALLGLSRSNQFPAIDANLTRGRSESSLRTATPLPPGTPRESDSYRATANVSYEVDLWGRLNSASESARAELLASEAAQETVRIALAADIVRAYFALQALDEQVAATQRSIDTRGESLSLQKVRFEVGAISEFEYRQLEAEVLAARAQLPVFERLRSQQENALAVLLGKSPRAIVEGIAVQTSTRDDAEIDSSTPTLVVPKDLPSQLLLRRPDLVESEQHLIAANAQIGVARASYFPTISLTGYFGNESSVLSELFTGAAGTWRAAVGLSQPLFRAGAVGATVDAANARQRQALGHYQQSIQNAFREVRDSIVAQTKTREQFEAEDKRVAALRDTLRLAKLRYQNGIASQLDTLDAERNLLAAQLSRSDALRAHRAAIADLFKALGGGWNV